MHGFRGAIAWGVMIAVTACGGSVDRKDQRPGFAAGAGGELADGGVGGAGADGGALATGGTAGAESGGASNGGAYDDPGCPDTPPSDVIDECDPHGAFSGCAPGERCIPTVQYADDCGTEVFGTECVPAGTGRQGDDCTDEACAEHFVCVTTGQGNQCVRICTISPDGQDDCDPGFLCQTLDVDGYYICF
jgi:hypothetical protein